MLHSQKLFEPQFHTRPINGSVKPSLNKLLKKAEDLPAYFCLFHTHASNDPQMYADAFKRIKKKIGEKSTILGEFHCLGESNTSADEQKVMLEGMTPEEKKIFQEARERIKGRPNAEDLENARTFGKSILEQL